MKKRLIILLLALSVLCLTFGLAGCFNVPSGPDNSGTTGSEEQGGPNNNQGGEDGDDQDPNGDQGGEEKPHTHTYNADNKCTECNEALKYTENLKYELNPDNQSYFVAGIGTATETDIVIPYGYNGLPVTSIGSTAFYGRTTLTSVTIPDSVTSVGEGAFRYCTSLESVYITDLKAWCNIEFADYNSTPLQWDGNDIYDDVNKITNDNKLYLNNNLVTEITADMLQGATEIKKFAFSNCCHITNVIIPDSVTSIGKGAFNQCLSLTSVTIPNSVTSIGEGAFNACSSLTSVTIPNSVTSIDDAAFYMCGLESITIPDSVTSIGEYTFGDCTSLTSITIPDSVTSIGDSAFWYCTSLTSITIGNGVTSIDDAAFYMCGLESITIPDSVTSIGEYTFGYCTSLTSVKFENTAGWKVSKYSSMSNAITVNVTDPAQNAIYLTDTYCDYYWKRG